MDLKIFTENIEGKAQSQVYELLAQSAFKDAKVRIMPDVHAGAGCVIGFTAPVSYLIVPNIIGVDIGCLDKDTEVLTREGWIRISEYKEGEILVYDKDNDAAFFEKPLAYIIKPCSEFHHYKNSKTLDQMVSSEHRMLVYKGFKGKGFVDMVCNPDELDSFSLESGYYNFKTSFSLNGEGLSYTDNQIRILAMVQADGSLYGETRIVLHFKKQRKIDRAIELLNKENIQYKTSPGSNGSIYITFSSSMFHTKDLTQFYCANKHQLEVLFEESLVWDGHVGYRSFYSTTNKRNADVIQFAFAANDIRASIHTREYNGHSNWKPSYLVIKTKNPYVNYSCHSVKVPSADGKKYCFTTSTGFFVARRNNNVFITGNCGVRVCKLGKIDIDLAAFDAYLKENIPAGMSVNRMDTCPEGWLRDNLLCFSHLKNVSWLTKSIGTLGGGNHFIEIDEDDEGYKYLVIHTGSRNVGKQVAEYYQDLAVRRCGSENVPELIKLAVETLKKMGREKDIQITIAKIKSDAARSKLPDDLCYLKGKDLEDYIHDMRFCQEFAVANRSAIWFKLGLCYLRRVCPDFDFDPLNSHSYFESVHNYISEDGMIRKGAISAHAGERVIIPLNMRDGSIIGIGKGNSDWNESAPHGAGRIMSRGEAKKSLSIEDFKESMEGIYTTTADMTTIDEAPMAYKDAKEILSAIGDTVEIEKVIKPIYNFKASEDEPSWRKEDHETVTKGE